MENNFATLKAGDWIFVKIRRLDGDVLLKKIIDKVTPGGKIKVNGDTFDQNGSGSGSPHNRSYLIHITPESELAYKRQNLLAFYKKLDFNLLSNDQLNEIYQIVKRDK